MADSTQQKDEKEGGQAKCHRKLKIMEDISYLGSDVNAEIRPPLFEQLTTPHLPNRTLYPQGFRTRNSTHLPARISGLWPCGNLGSFRGLFTLYMDVPSLSRDGTLKLIRSERFRQKLLPYRRRDGNGNRTEDPLVFSSVL
jgi:hypothetical protein